MRASVTNSDKTKATSTNDVFAKEPAGSLPLPWRSVDDTAEGIVLGFRQNMLDLAQDGETIATVSTGSGLGTDFIQFSFREHSGVIRGRDLLLAFVQEVAPGEYEELRRAIYPVEEEP